MLFPAVPISTEDFDAVERSNCLNPPDIEHYCYRPSSKRLTPLLYLSPTTRYGDSTAVYLMLRFWDVDHSAFRALL